MHLTLTARTQDAGTYTPSNFWNVRCDDDIVQINSKIM